MLFWESIMKKINYALLIIILGLSHHVSAQDGMILPMPGMKPSSQTSTNSNKANTNTQRNERQGQTNNRNTKPNNYKDSSGAILPLPNLNNRTEPEPEQKQPKNETKNTRQPQKPVDNPHTEPLIAIPPMDNSSRRTQPPSPPPAPAKPKTPEVVDVSKPADPMAEEVSDFLNDGNDFPIPSNEFTASVENTQVEDLLPAAEADTTVAKDAFGGNITVYPKDTGAAIFMVMKSWQCEDYDAVGLINQALEVYGKDAGDTYQIDGLDNITSGLKVSVEEEDITFDELLDILASKTGNDWGCNVQSKTIYIYPKGIKTESYVSWE